MAAARCFTAPGDPEEAKASLARACPGAVVLAVRRKVVHNESFAEMLAAQTLEAASSGSLLANKPAIDLLLRLAGTTQIAEAISGAGARKGEPFVVVVAAAEAALEGASPGQGWTRLPRRALTRPEMARVEAAALLAVRKG